MISISETISSNPLRRAAESSSVELLDTIPTELLHSILNLLDFRSLSHFMRVCHRGKEAVESVPTYQQSMKYASTALIALSRTKLVTFHSAASFHWALISESCVSCQNYAPFLCLPTCERCCYQCLQREISLRVIKIRMAVRCFGISRRDLHRVLAMQSIQGTYSVSHEATYPKQVDLVSLKQAIELGISLHGSKEAMGKFVSSWKGCKLTRDESRIIEWLHSRRSIISIICANSLKDLFCGMASIAFPSLRRNGMVQNGLWCLGCRSNFENYDRTRELDGDTELLVSGLLVLGFNPEQALLRLQRLGRTKSELIEHVRKCKGARVLLQKSKDEIQST